MSLSLSRYGQERFVDEAAKFGFGTREARGRQQDQQPVRGVGREGHHYGRGHRAEAATPAPAPTPAPAADTAVVSAEVPQEGQPISLTPGSEQLQGTSRTKTTTSDLQFQVKTAEGDTVTLSVNAVQQYTKDKVSYQSEDGSFKAVQKTQSSSLSASLSVDGDLSEAELADISKALESLSQGKTLDNLGTLTSASFQYNSRTVYSQASLSVVA